MVLQFVREADWRMFSLFVRVLIGGVHAGETAIVIIITMGVERSTQRLQTIPVLVSVVISPAVESLHLLDSGLQLGGNILLQTGHGLAERNGMAWASVDQLSLLRASSSQSSNGPIRHGGTLARQTCSFLIKPSVVRACCHFLSFPRQLYGNNQLVAALQC